MTYNYTCDNMLSINYFLRRINMTIEDALIKYYGGRAEYSCGRLYRIGDKRVEYSCGQLSYVGNDRIDYSCGRLYQVGGNRVEYQSNEIYKIGGIVIR